MWILLALVGGILVGAVAASVFIYAKAIGSLRVDHSDLSEPPYLFLEVEKNPDTLEHGKLVGCGSSAKILSRMNNTCFYGAI